MPHFIIECSENILQDLLPETLMQAVQQAARDTGLFAPGDIKVRIQPYQYYLLEKESDSFLHVFAYIMEGRTTAQKAALSRAIIERLNELLPQLPILSMNVSDFEAAAYCNKSLIHPDNTEGNRHFLL